MIETSYTIKPIGIVRSKLAALEEAPLQGYEGAPDAWLELTALVREGLIGIGAGDELIVPLAGVFATRSQDRPNPVGLHRVSVLEVVGLRLRVAPIEAIDGTPIIDIKVALSRSDDG
jgi:tRNA (Thr-GGU) A37 N-methylase